MVFIPSILKMLMPLMSTVCLMMRASGLSYNNGSMETHHSTGSGVNTAMVLENWEVQQTSGESNQCGD